jgi:hypothetical protein
MVVLDPGQEQHQERRQAGGQVQNTGQPRGQVLLLVYVEGGCAQRYSLNIGRRGAFF